MAEEQQQELKEYVITKIAEDGKTIQDKTSEDYTGRAQVQYPNGDVFDGYFLNVNKSFKIMLFFSLGLIFSIFQSLGL